MLAARADAVDNTETNPDEWLFNAGYRRHQLSDPGVIEQYVRWEIPRALRTARRYLARAPGNT